MYMYMYIHIYIYIYTHAIASVFVTIHVRTSWHIYCQDSGQDVALLGRSFTNGSPLVLASHASFLKQRGSPSDPELTG